MSNYLLDLVPGSTSMELLWFTGASSPVGVEYTVSLSSFIAAEIVWCGFRLTTGAGVFARQASVQIENAAGPRFIWSDPNPVAAGDIQDIIFAPFGAASYVTFNRHFVSLGEAIMMNPSQFAVSFAVLDPSDILSAIQVLLRVWRA